MDQIVQDITNHEFKNREAYTKDTKAFLNRIKEIDESERKNEIIKLLIKLYDDLMESINLGKDSVGAINDDAIEGILAIADACIEEQNEKRKNPDIEIKLEEDLNNILQNEEDVRARVNAFYSLCTKHRRLKEYKKFKELLDNVSNNEVRKNEIFKIMQAYYHIQEPAVGFNPTKALTYWESNMISSIYKRLPAFTQIYTETIVLLYETTKQQNTNLLQESESLIEDAIDMRKYAKFYSTLGRIYCCKGKYENAIEQVRKAIEAEDYGRGDYTSRINEYEGLISRFQRKKDERELKEQTDKLAKQAEELANQAKDIKTEMEKSKTDYISILGFFSAIMALIIGTIDISRQAVSMIDSLPLLMGIAGMIIISFGSLNLILVRKDEKCDNKYPDWILIAIGGCVIVLSFIARLLYKYLQTNNWI